MPWRHIKKYPQKQWYADCEMFNQVVDNLHIPTFPLCHGETSPGDDRDMHYDDVDDYFEVDDHCNHDHWLYLPLCHGDTSTGDNDDDGDGKDIHTSI